MSGWIVHCPHCSTAARLDPKDLPDGPVTYPCPQCKREVVVDKRQASGQAATPPAEPAADRRFPKLPANATLPSGLVVGEDDALVREVQSTLAGLGSEIERAQSPETARGLIVNEGAELCIYVGGEIPSPPFAELRSLTALTPECRRRVYMVLIGDNLKTLDGNSAFLYDVNLVVGRQDLAQLGAVLHAGIEYHERLYAPFVRAAERKLDL